MKKAKSIFLWVRMITKLCFFVPIMVYGQIQISDEAGLKAIVNDLTADYVLMSDITLTEEWMPIGTNVNRFTGSIDGNGKTIYGLQCFKSSVDGIGFIGVAEGATITNLSIVAARIYGGQNVGAIIGQAYAPTIVEKCYSSGSISGYDHVGGIIGGSQKSNPEGETSRIQDCFSTAAIVSTSWQAGGILGASVDMDVLNTYFAGIAICPSGRTGGIVAFADGGSTFIVNSMAAAPYLKGDESNRILGGENSNVNVTLENNHSWENTEVYVKNALYTDGESNPNGNDGTHQTEATLKMASFYANTLEWNNSVWKIEDGKYPLLAHQTYPIDGDGIYVPLFPERALPGVDFNAQAISSLNRPITYLSSNPAVASISSNGLVSFLANGTTMLTFSTQGDANYSGATVSIELKVEGISYSIRTEEDLRNIKYDLEGDFTLMNDITLVKDWELLGTFKGKLNGNGKVIYGLKYENREQYRVGLFGKAEGAVITKLGIERANIVGNGDVGFIIGDASGCTISECYVADSYIAGRDHVASIVGAMRALEENENKTYTTIKNCYSSAQIYSREFQAAGIAGIICGGILENCYFSGQIQSEKNRSAGIVALVDNGDPGEVRNNINLAAAVYSPESYRIGDWGSRAPANDNNYLKFINNWSVLQSYFGSDLANSAVKENCNDANDKDGSTVSNDNLARTQNFYVNTLGWDFSNTWKFVTGTEGKIYPVLKWQEAPFTSKIYGIPQPTFLTWYENSDEYIHLGKIIATHGQTLEFEIKSGAQYVDREGSLLYITETPLTQEGITKVAIKTESALAGILNLSITDFDIEILLRTTVYDVATVEQLLNINDKPFAKYRLMKDINMTGVPFYGIGSTQEPFIGELDGNGFSIINPVVITNGENKKGLFNVTNGAQIKKLGVVNFSFSGSSKSGSDNVDLGALVGSCRNTTIDQCYVTGTVIGRDHVGGLIGGDCDNVTVKNTYIDVHVEGSTQIGGFFGVTAGSVTVENSYFAGTVKMDHDYGWAGGIIGLIDRPGNIKISNTVSIGDVLSPGRNGAFIGGNGSNGSTATIATFSNNLYNFDATTDSNGSEWNVESESDNIKFPIGKSTAQLKLQATYAAIGWDFNNVWTIVEGQSYPQLKAVKQQLSAISEIGGANKEYKVYVSDNKCTISGIEQSATVTVYSVNGRIALPQSVVTDQSVLNLPAKGFYIVRIIESGTTTSLKVINH